MIETMEPKTQFKRLPLDEDGNLLQAGPLIESPRNLVIVKYPKSGSTLSLCDVPKILIGDSEEGTSNFTPRNSANLIDSSVADKFVKTNSYGYIPQTIFDLVDELKGANKMEEYWILYNNMMNERNFSMKEERYNIVINFINQMPFPIFAVDTITSILHLSNAAALYEYNKVYVKTQKADIKRVDDYGGTMYIRRKFGEIKRFIQNNAAPFIQYHGHVASRKKILRKSDEDISVIDIALDGLLSVMFTSEANAVCTFYRDDTGCYLDFAKKDETDMGSRCLHLSNQKIKIAEKTSDADLRKGIRPITHWDEVYPEIEAFKK